MLEIVMHCGNFGIGLRLTTKDGFSENEQVEHDSP
jgi:hypothetical protein